jgi:hypothetical protein
MKLNLDLSQVQAQTGGLADILPEGVYLGKIVSVEGKSNKAGTGHYLEIVFSVVSGEHKGKNIVERLNVSNHNADAQRIALSTLKGILEVGGHPNPNMLVDTDDMLKLRPMLLTLTVEKQVQGDKEYTNNRIKKYKANDEAAPASVAPAAQAAPAVAAPATFP